jgi:hypothetical protein
LLFGLIPYSFDLPYRDNAIAISDRSADANENPSAVTPKKTGPQAKDVITANTKPKAERQINIIWRLLMVILLLPLIKFYVPLDRPCYPNNRAYIVYMVG